MKLSPQTEALFIAQVSHELAASHSYLGMASYMDAQDLPGFANWFRVQSAEENMHAMKLYDFLVACGAKVTLEALPQPRIEFQSPKAVFEAGLAQEQAVTEQIKAMYRSATDEGDFVAHPLLHWFLAEQVEEEDSFETAITRIEAAQTRFDLLVLDDEMGARSPEAEAEA